MIEELTPDTNFCPCPAVAGDELYANGIFVFNISRMLAHIGMNPADFPLEDVDVSDLDDGLSSLNEAYVQSVDVSRPVVLAEITPGQFKLIDGHHRVAKASRQSVKTIRAHKLTVLQHIHFLIRKEAYLKYIEYWNEKVNRNGKIRKVNKRIVNKGCPAPSRRS